MIQLGKAAVVYVKRTASGTNNGASWTNAYTDLKTALAIAASGGSVWIAADTFFLNTDRSYANAITNKTLYIYGGFPNTGNPSSLSQRDIKLYKTIISGDIVKKDAAFDGNTTKSSSDRSDNAYHFFVISQNAASYAVLVDGITLEGGNANGSNNDAYGAGVFYSRSATGNGSQTHQISFVSCEFRNLTATSGACYYSSLGFAKCDAVRLGFLTSQIHNTCADDFPIPSLACPTNVATDYSINFNSFGNNNLKQPLGLICAEGPKYTSHYNQIVAINNASYNNYPANCFYYRAGKTQYQSHLIDYNMFEVTDSFIIKYSGGHDVIGESEIFKQSSSDNYALRDCSPAINSGNTTVYFQDKVNAMVLSLSTTVDAAYNNRTNYSSIDRVALEYIGSKYPSYLSINLYACFGEKVNFDGKQIGTSGLYHDTLVGATGCDPSFTTTL